MVPLSSLPDLGVPGLVLGTSLRQGPGGAPLSVSFRICEDRKVVLAHREEVARSLGTPLGSCVFGEQVHGAGVAVVGKDDVGSGAMDPATAIPKVDALVTRDRGVFLAGLSADCAMVFVADERSGAIGLAHSSWRSTVLGVCTETVRTMSKVFGARASDLRAAISPSIGPCCFVVKEDFIAQAMPAFRAHPELLDMTNGRMRFNLWGAVRMQLREVGILDERIRLSGLCTSCRTDLFYSHRRDGAPCGRMMSAIGWSA